MFSKSATCLWLLIFCAIGVGLASGQEDGTSCYGPGSIATSVILTIIFTALLLGALYHLWKKYRKRKERHLILETDPEKGKGEYAFDNPGFKEVGLTPVTKSLEKQTKFESTSNNKPKWNHWPHLSAIAKSEKRKTLDDSILDGSQVKVVPLRGHDFTGLGFTVCGNMKEGIYVRDVLHRGPALESGKLSAGDRINSVTISFEHMVYEDALSILSYASPYEVIIEARSGKTITQSPGQGAQPAHPIYRSSSAINLSPIEQGAKKRLFGEEFATPGSNYSSLQKSQSNMTTLERKESKSPRPLLGKPKKAPMRIQLSPEQLKTQLEQKIQSDHEQNLRNKENHNQVKKIDLETQKTENKLQKFGIRVLPPTQTSPRIESSQNDNNINIEKQPMGIDEVDDHSTNKPQAKRREKKADENSFKRDESLNGSGIRRDANGIPQEIPNYMLNAAVAARSNRRNSEDKFNNKMDEETTTPSKKPKGKAPAPPPTEDYLNKPKMNGGKVSPVSNLDEIHAATDDDDIDLRKSPIKNEEEVTEDEQVVEMRNKKDPVKDYNSDSDLEQDNQSSVNTIELNSSDITIHQAEENEDLQNRKTASTGDLTKIHKTRKSSTGTLERAQSLDITDTTIPTLSKKRKGGRLEDTFDLTSDEDLFGKALVNKEPRLSLILDGLNTFQRNRLKKSTEWGNLEDAILKLDKEDAGIRFNQNAALDKFDFGEKSREFDALVNKINEIKRESTEISNTDNKKKKNQIWPTFDHNDSEIVEIIDNTRPIPADKRQRKPSEERTIEDEDKKTKPMIPEKKDFLLESRLISKAIYPPSLPETEELNTEPQVPSSSSKWEDNKSDEIKTHQTSPQPEPIIINRELLDMTKNFIFTERIACSEDDDEYLSKVGEDTNISDDIKVSRHSLGSLERPKSDDAKLNVSNVTISSAPSPDNLSMEVNLDETPQIDDSRFNDLSELYTTALDNTVTSAVINKKGPGVDYESGKVTITTPDIIKNVTITEAINTLNSEQEPRSLTLEIPMDSSSVDNFDSDSNRSKNSSLTYITEIQVITPANASQQSTNISEIEIIPGERRDLDDDFENYVKNFESNVKSFETNIQKFENNLEPIVKTEIKSAEKIQEIAEEQLKKLPEMRFTTSSYESPTKIVSPMSHEKRQSQIELLRSNFEKTSPPKSLKGETKSRIPIATTAKTPPTSPERRDSRNLDMENDRDILELMSASVHSTPAPKYQMKAANSKNVTVTSIRSNSKLPSGLPILGGGSRPPIPPRKSTDEGENNVQVQVSTNGGMESSFKQWVFNPNNHSDHSVTNIVVSENVNKQK